mmetsp:Transcript_20478/g.29618  ORF Transcript_20478/g.29618 Transcript_20478/m.29618 type:complete len:368 (-) Transcript_20478:173-1276(-)
MAETKNGNLITMSRRQLALLLSGCVLVASLVVSFYGDIHSLSSRSLTASLRSASSDPSLALGAPTLREENKPLKVLMAVPSYGTTNKAYLEEMIDSIRDMCEAGVQVTLALYLTSNTPLNVSQSYMLNSRMQCRHPRGHFKTKVIYLPPSTGKYFARPHRDLFFENMHKFNLFIYIEDDMMIRLRHIVAYIEETKKLKALTREKFTKYSIGFLRYEINPQTRERTQFEHPDADFKIVEDPLLNDDYITHPSSHHHQAMYMATPEQLEAWKESCNCFRDTLQMEKDLEPILFRENLSSACLFGRCKVLPVLPRIAFQDLMIHHMSDKYMHGVISAGSQNKLKTTPISKIFDGAGKSMPSGRSGFIVDI